jgi:UDP-glucose 6-dehydrogenase
MRTHEDAGAKIGIIGGGFVGITLAAHLLENSQTRVTIFEQSTEKINLFHKGNYQVREPELDEILNLAWQEGRLSFNLELTQELDSIFICVGTPKGLSRNNQLEIFQSILFRYAKSLKTGGHIW